MDSQQFLYINVIFGILLAYLFLSGRNSGALKSNPLSMKNKNTKNEFSKEKILEQQKKSSGLTQVLESDSAIVNGKTSNPTNGFAKPKKKYPTNDELMAELKKEPVRDSVQLNIFFNYNGHSWDAYEVLGLPAGTSLPNVTEAYQKIIIAKDPKSREFFEAAYSAILKRI